MTTYIEHHSARTLHASKRLTMWDAKRFHVLHNVPIERPAVRAGLLARLAALGFGVTDVGHGRTLVTPGTVEVDGMWRRARPASRWIAPRDQAALAGEAARRAAAIEEREEAARQAAERARAEAERHELSEELRHVRL